MAETSESDHERIFLAPLNEPEDLHQGRMWCEDDGNWESPGVEFIRLDLHQAAIAAAEARGRAKGLEEAAKIAENYRDKWAAKIAAQKTEEGVAAVESAASAGGELAAAIRAAKEGENDQSSQNS